LSCCLRHSTSTGASTASCQKSLFYSTSVCRYIDINIVANSMSIGQIWCAKSQCGGQQMALTAARVNY
jgi:hypothetical protein